MKRTVYSISALIAAIVAFVAINIISQQTLRTARADLTEGKLFTISEGARTITRSLSEPIRLTLYYSEQGGNDASIIKPYAARVKELLAEFAAASGGKIDLRIVNPEPFSDAEDEAVGAGLAGIPTGRGSERLYFGLVGRNSTDRTEVIPFFAPDKEQFLEYDLTRLVFLLSDAPKRTIGLMTWLPLEGQTQQNPFGGRPQPPMQIYRQMSEFFTVKSVPITSTEIPADIGVMMVVHPKKMSARTQYALDQFVLRGGRLLLFVDPYCEMDVPPGINPMQAMNIPKDSEAETLLAAWGAQMEPAKIAADRQSALTINAGSPNRPEPVDHVAFLSLPPARRDATDPITGSLQQNITIGAAGILSKKDGATTTFTPLLKTSTNSMALDASQFAFMPDLKKMVAEFSASGREFTLAARITGAAKSAFPDGRPAAEPGSTEPETPASATPHLAESSEDANIVVVADCDMLADRFWIEPEQRLGPIVLPGRAWADNGNFVIGALDNLSGSRDLQSLRARGRSTRPFDRVLGLQREAEQRYLAKETELQTRLRDTEQKIADLQRQKSDTPNANPLVLSPEQRQEIERFRAQMVDTRKQLREVRHQLRKDIEGLGTRVKAINIALMPLLVGLAAVSLAAVRSARRKADRRSVGATT